MTFEQFAAVDIWVGRVIEVEEFPEARRPAWKLRIDFGPEIGIKRSSAQITNYSDDELLNRMILAVVNFPPCQIGPVRPRSPGSRHLFRRRRPLDWPGIASAAW